MDSVKCEDGLNIVNSNFIVDFAEFNETYSDAIDVDFGNGVFQNILMDNIGYAGGGDGLDVSGSIVIVEGALFDDVGDKAISVGEGSNLTLKNTIIQNSLVGVASKDGSTAIIKDVKIHNSGLFDLMAYRKKPEYDFPRLTISDKDSGEGYSVFAETGATVARGNYIFPTNEIDVDDLYENQMKSSK